MKALLMTVLLASMHVAFAQDVSPILRGQVLLDRAHYSVGEIDGVMGSTTESALKLFQQAKSIEVTGVFDNLTMQGLEDSNSILTTHTLTHDDLRGPFGGKAQFRDVDEKLGEVFQISPALLHKLNPSAKFAVGEALIVPAIGGPLPPNSISKIVVTRSEKSIKVFSADGTQLAYYPTTMGADETVPYGERQIISTVKNPSYRHITNGKLVQYPPGPNSPVGDIWMQLSAPHYGMHGSPMPDFIAKQQSLGCIRLTNWDAREVAASIAKNVTVTIQR